MTGSAKNRQSQTLLLSSNNKVVNYVEEQEAIILFKSPVPLFERHGRESTGLGPKRSEFEFAFDLEQVT